MLNRFVSLLVATVVLAPVASITGCGAGTPSSGNANPSANGASAAATVVYVMGPTAGTPSSTGTVLGYALSGNGTPLTTLTMPVGEFPISLATAPSGELYVGTELDSTGGNSYFVHVYPAGANGAATPTRTLSLLYPYLPWHLAIDRNGLLYVMSPIGGGVDPDVRVYPAGASGSVAPVRELYIADLSDASDLAVDDSGNIYLSGGFINVGPIVGTDIAMYGPTAKTGDLPTRTFTTQRFANSFSLDPQGNIWVITFTDNTGSAQMVQEYAAGDTGKPTPINSLTLPVVFPVLPASERNDEYATVRVDGAGNVYVGGLYQQFGLFTALAKQQALICGFAPGSGPASSPTVNFIPAGAVSQIISVD